MSDFRFLKNYADRIQKDINFKLDEKVCGVRDQIDAMITEAAYEAAADIISENKIEDIPGAEPEEIHDEIFNDFVDSLYNELGIY